MWAVVGNGGQGDRPNPLSKGVAKLPWKITGKFSPKFRVIGKDNNKNLKDTKQYQKSTKLFLELVF